MNIENNNNISSKISSAKSFDSSLFDSSLEELFCEADDLFKVLDNVSDTIRKLESSLSDLKANFSYALLVKTEKESREKKIEPRHIENCPYVANFYSTQDISYLTWEIDEKSNKYRFFLVKQEREWIYWEAPEGGRRILHQTQEFFKKPLIETSLETRLEYSEYLIPFINSFKNFLKEKRRQIETSALPF